MGGNVVVLFCGLPASGKSYLINKFCQIVEEKLFYENNIQLNFTEINLHRISYDDLIPLPIQREMIHTAGKWKECRKNILCATEAFICQVLSIPVSVKLSDIENIFIQKLVQSTERKNCSNLFLVEDNFYYRSMRHQWFLIAQKLGIGFCQVYLECPQEIAITRNLERKRNVPTDVIHTMAERIEVPCPESNSWEINSLVINTAVEELNNDCLYKILNVIQTAMKNPLVPVSNGNSREEAQKTCSTNAIHQIDILLRKLTGEKIKRQNVYFKDKKMQQEYSKHIINTRQELLKRLKQGQLILERNLLNAIEEGRQNDVAVQLKEVLEFMLDSLTSEQEESTH